MIDEHEGPESANSDGADKHDGVAALRADLLEPTLINAVFTGFTRQTLHAGALDAGHDAADADLAWPYGVDDFLAYWSGAADQAAIDYLAGDGAEGRIRERVAGGVLARIETFEPHKEAARRAANTLLLPGKQRLAARLVWRSADAIWRGLGDPSRDFNYYSKRTILSGVISTTQARWLTDDDPEIAATKAFLDARIENVMQFEKFKARFKDVGFDPSAIIRAAAKARYGA
ncbi:MAG: COQ9 family protein [Pseudomonadota bacterium]